MPDIREALSAALEAQEPAESAVVETPIEAVETEVTPRVDATGRVHAPDGKFAAKVTETPADTPAPEQVPQEAIAPVQALPRPSSWKKDYEAHWQKIATENPEVAKYIQEREGQFASGVSTYKAEYDRVKPLQDAIEPFKPLLQQHNIAPEQWIRNLGQAHQTLTFAQPVEKLNKFAELAQQYGVPAKLVVQDAQGQWQFYTPQAAAQPQQPSITPETVEQMVAEKLAEREILSEVQKFQAAKDAAGNPKYPHYEVVRQTMVGLLQSNLAQDLDEAYNAALRHPRHADLYEQMNQQSQQVQVQAKAQAAAKAKAKAVSVKSATPANTATANSGQGLRSKLEAAWAEHAEGRV
jgi:hypothetical protein